MQRFREECGAHFAAQYQDGRAFVFGEGRMRPALMLIGEAPGEQEARLGRPFVGKAGKNLDEILSICGLRREELYISNVVKFRPTKPSPKTGKPVNRTPTPREIADWTPWLLREIGLVQPGCIATLGNVPLRALAGKNAVIGALHGRLVEGLPWPLFPLYHPASIIYNRALRSVYIGDVEKLAAHLNDI